MVFQEKKNTPSAKLDAVLALCQKAAKEGHKTAEKYLSIIRNSLEGADAIIENCKNTIDGLRLGDWVEKAKGESFQQTLSKELDELRVQFWQTYYDCEDSVSKKAKETASFNLTVFGATMTGKSTLMSILTKGHDDAIGKGGQRTTRDVRKYEWNGLTITDVPGICAVQGEEDTKWADDASIYADMILFLVNCEEPSDEEADWLVRLKRRDKPILCVINYHASLASEMDLEIFLEDPKSYINSADMAGVKNQFREFVHKRLPNEPIDIIVSHFLSRKYADKPEYQEYRDRLLRASNFDKVEQAIVRTVHEHGLIYRKRCFLSIIDIPLYEQMHGMISFFRQSKGMHDLAFKKRSEFDKWKESYLIEAEENITQKIKSNFDLLKSKIPAFVDEHLGSSSFNKSLNDFIAKQEVSTKIKEDYNLLYQRTVKIIRSFFVDLEKETSFSMRWMKLSDKGVFIFDTKKAVKWGGIALSIVFAFSTGGWSLLGIPVSFLIDFIVGRLPSKDEKKKKKKAEIVASVNSSLDKQRDKCLEKMKELIKDDIENGLMRAAVNRFNALKISIESMLDGQRHLVRCYNQCHREVSTIAIAHILDYLGYNEEEYKSLSVARIPGKWTLIIPGDERIWKKGREFKKSNDSVCWRISNQLGNKERVDVLWLQPGSPKANQAYFMLRFMFGADNHLYHVNEQFGYMYLDRSLFVPDNEDKINLIQQVLDIEVIPNDKYHGED